MSDYHRCKAMIPRLGQRFWGRPWERPLSDPIPPELLERHPDVTLDWDNCDRCGQPMCGKPARFRIEDDVWLCADHWDSFMEVRLANWHECADKEEA